MGRHKEGDRVCGPYEESYKEGVRYRVVLFVGERREAHLFDGRAEAETYAADARGALSAAESRTIGEAIEAFQEATAPTLKPLSAAVQKGRLLALFEGATEEPLSALTKKGRAAQLYEALSRRPSRRAREPRPVSAAYHRGALKAARRFLAWCVEKGWLGANPFADVKGTGRVRKRKIQHRLTEAQRFYAAALEMAAGGTPPQRVGALGALTALLLSLRQSEVSGRQVRDLDGPLVGAIAGARDHELAELVQIHGDKPLWLVIDEGKTEHSKGTLEVPEDLRLPLLRLAAGRPPEAPLFWYPGRTAPRAHEGDPFDRTWLLRWTGAICERAGVPRIVAHSLRGQGSSIAAARGVLPRVIAEGLRHGNDKITREHYIEPAALAAAERGRLADLLRGGAPELAELVGRLTALAEQWRGEGRGEQADQLLAALLQRGNCSRIVPGARHEARN